MDLNPDTGREALAAEVASIIGTNMALRKSPREIADDVLAALSRSPERATAGEGEELAEQIRRTWVDDVERLTAERDAARAALPAPAADDAPSDMIRDAWGNRVERKHAPADDAPRPEHAEGDSPGSAPTPTGESPSKGTRTVPQD